VTAMFFAIIGAMALVSLMLYDMDRKRRLMAETLDTVEPLIKKSHKTRLRIDNLRRLSKSLFFNSQLLVGLERELLELEEAHGVPESPDLLSVTHANSTMKRLKALGERLSKVELVVQAQVAAKAKADADAAAEAEAQRERERNDDAVPSDGQEPEPAP
jgi:hypothetical protein